MPDTIDDKTAVVSIAIQLRAAVRIQPQKFAAGLVIYRIQIPGADKAKPL
jgi:hypothetical protein